MATRHQVRQAVISMLYADEYGSCEDASMGEILESKKIRNEQKKLAFNLYEGVQSHVQHLDRELNEHLREYKIDKVASTERAILRLGCFELLYTNTQVGVVINEAILLAKEFGTQNSPSLINAILDHVKKEES